MSTPQEYWDACLIKTWRNFGLLLDAVQMFKSITGKEYYEYDPPLFRIPAKGYPFHTGIRIFIANHLSKISKRLLEQPPEKDVLLLKKLKDSKYDTEKDVINDSELNAQKHRYYRNRLRVGMDTQLYAKRNRDTDWNVIKGTHRGRAR